MWKALIIILIVPFTSLAQDSSCQCDTTYINYHPKSDFAIDNWGNWKDTLNNWLKENDPKSVKILEISWFGALPKEFKRFINVEILIIQNSGGKVLNLDYFPNLKSLFIEESRVKFSKRSGLQHIRNLYANKSEVIGIKSFSYLPQLRTVYMTYSGFDKFPTKFEELNMLCSFVTGATTFGQIDLNLLDLQLNKCLENAQFHTWNNNIKGIPRNFHNLKSIKIEHPNLTEEEKEKLK
jgi:hypothetical protein